LTSLERLADRGRLRAAFDRVRAQGGAPGVDGMDPVTFGRDVEESVTALARSLLDGSYVPKAMRAMRLPRHADPRGRELHVPTVTDRVAQRAFVDLVAPALEAHQHPGSFAYRPGRSAARAAELVRSALPELPWVVDADIESFFSSVRHDLLAEQMRAWLGDERLVRLVERWVCAPVVRAGAVHRQEIGLPTGAPISPLLANLFLTPLDQAVGTPPRVYARFADDFVVCCREELDARACLRLAQETLSILGLRVNTTKTRVLDAREESFVFVGHLLRLNSVEADPSERFDRPRRRTLYVSDPGSALTKRGERLAVHNSGVEVVSVPLREIGAIVAFGACNLTAAALVACIERGIPVSLLSARGRWCGRFESWCSPMAAVRHRQALAALDPACAVVLARSFVCGKVQNQRRLLQRHAARRGSEEVRLLAPELTTALEAARAAGTLDALRGAEGAASRAYFAAFGHLLGSGEEWGFRGRVRRPPRDPINSMLSFGYTVLTNEVTTALLKSGLDSYTGFLHSPRHGRHSLALDLVEEVRPVIVDALVLSVVHRNVLRPEHFATDPVTDAVHLSDDARKIFLREYERRVLTLATHPRTGERVSYRRALELQAQQLIGVLYDADAAYLPLQLG